MIKFRIKTCRQGASNSEFVTGTDAAAPPAVPITIAKNVTINNSTTNCSETLHFFIPIAVNTPS